LFTRSSNLRKGKEGRRIRGKEGRRIGGKDGGESVKMVEKRRGGGGRTISKGGRIILNCTHAYCTHP